jgi:LysM repeat protein
MSPRRRLPSGPGRSPTLRRLAALTLLAAWLVLVPVDHVWATVPTASAANPVHRVKTGDTLSGIARRNGLSVAELKRRNGLTTNLIKPGQRLRLTEPSPPLPVPVLPGSFPMEPGTTESGVATAALDYLATPYRFGGNDRRGLDCSAFAQRVFRDRGIELPRTAREQFRLGADVPPEELTTGDLLFFRTYAAYPSHVGIYLGGGKMVHASVRSRRIVVSAIDSPYFRSRYLGAKRLAQERPVLEEFSDLPQESGYEDPLAADEQPR